MVAPSSWAPFEGRSRLSSESLAIQLERRRGERPTCSKFNQTRIQPQLRSQTFQALRRLDEKGSMRAKWTLQQASAWCGHTKQAQPLSSSLRRLDSNLPAQDLGLELEQIQFERRDDLMSEITDTPSERRRSHPIGEIRNQFSRCVCL